jgi:uncharacterized membrane protein YoaK (UPF0700 family)
MSNVNIAVISTILLFISLIVVIYACISGKKIYSFMMKVLIIFIILLPCVAQEDTAVDSRPIILPEVFVEGTEVLEEDVREVVDYVFEDGMWRQSAHWFLYGDMNVSMNESTNLLNETNLTNLTA